MLKKIIKWALIILLGLIVLAIALVCLLFWWADNGPRLQGQKRLDAAQVAEVGRYETVIKDTYKTEKNYSVIYYPELAEDEVLPVVVFTHGYFIFNISDSYEDTLVRLASEGYVVLSLNYENLFDSPETYVDRAAAQLLDGLDYAEGLEHITLARDEEGILLGVMGHSAGGVTAINLAATWQEHDIPRPRFIFTLEACDGGSNLVPMYDASTVSPDTNVLMVYAEGDDENTYRTSSTYWSQLAQVPEERKQWVLLRHDSHGEEHALANHDWMMSINGSTVDNLRRYGSWKWAVGIANDTFYGTDRALWYGGTEEQTGLGTWSDGTPLVPAEVSDTEALRP